VFRRERLLKHKMEVLLKLKDENEFRAGVQADFGITPDDPRYEAMLKIWRDAQLHRSA
jgi:hypothetical protein